MKARLLEIIQKHWGYSSLRPLQEEAMMAALSRRDSLVVMPTGGGKSLCFQAPALLGDTVTVVVSPLISLMKDQVDGLAACGVPASQMNSSLSPAEQRQTERDILGGGVKLLFVSPERLAMQSFRDLLRRANVRTFAIDEAHCISHWGHDFRPEYRQLRTLHDEFGDASIHAYTATATPEVRRDIANQLGLREPLVLVGDFDRPNLTYRVLPRQDEAKQVAEVLERHRGEAGIIYCARRRDVDALTEKLRKRGYDAVAYHAGLEPAARREAQEKFASETCDLVVATVAFGMGIDRSNVRFVLHTAMPKSIEHYQQESGRAGRDGLEAECVLLYSGADYMSWKSMLAHSPAEVMPSLLRHLGDIERYCSGAACRHRALVEYFGQRFATDDCKACDICLGETEEVEDALTIAQKIVSCVYRVRESFGVGHVAAVLRGEESDKVRERHHDQLSTYGLLKGHTRHDVREWIYQLVAQEFLAQTDDQYPVLRLGSRAREVLRGHADVKLRQPAVRKKDPRPRASGGRVAPAEGLPYDRGLFDVLRQWRREEAQERGVPPYIIFSDRTLRDLARLRPTTRHELRGVYGIGEAKLEAFGDAVIARIAEHAAGA